MNLSEINWDINASGTWPLPIKALAALIICSLVAGGWVYYDTMDQLDELDKVEKEEQSLRTAFEEKQKKAANLQDYRDQLKQIEASLGEMLRQMPTKAEVANLLVDISQTGLASGLEFKLFQPKNEKPEDFYVELPIEIHVVGQYEELGLFVSGLASLPRIVTVHDVSITPEGTGKKEGGEKATPMFMKATIKTYNEAQQATESPKTKKRGKK